MLLQPVALLLFVSSLTLAGLIPRDISLPPSRVIAERQATTTSPVPDGACTNGPNTRFCWKEGFSISTDFDAKAPPAGKTVTYNLEITNTTINADGNGSKLAMLVNGQYPGPTIRAAWGDTLVVNVKNSLEHNGTGIHWHGLRQLNSCQQDGVPGITECPIAPHKTRQYVFKCTQFGTSWYHSHWSAQYSEGVVGPIVIDGPATAGYEEDLGPVALTDYYYSPGFELNEQAQLSTGGPPIPDNILVNGKHKNRNGGGEYHKMTVTKGKRYRIRLINTSVDSVFHVKFDGHPMVVMTSDFVPIKTYVADQITLQIGQRYDVVINANQAVGNYWMHVAVGTDCGVGNKIIDAGIPLGAILHYDGASNADPPQTDVTMRSHCNDETGLVPFVPNSVPTNIMPGGANGDSEMDINHVQDDSTENLFRWTVDGSTQIVNWTQPTLKTAVEGGLNFGNHSNIHEMTTKDRWYMWWIQTRSFIALPHPIHLHGHDFYILGSGDGVWDQTTTGLNFNNPTRRDTATLPGGGYLLIAFPADNPGLWVMHCHIAWHASQGLSVQFLERKGEISAAIGDRTEFNRGCQEWETYWPSRVYDQTDSGI